MYVSHPFAMNMTIVPQMLSMIPRHQCTFFAAPFFHASHP